MVDQQKGGDRDVVQEMSLHNEKQTEKKGKMHSFERHIIQQLQSMIHLDRYEYHWVLVLLMLNRM